MRRRKDAHIRPKHDPVPDRHETAVQDRQVEVRVHPVPQADVAPVVDPEGRLDEDVVADFADDALEAGEALGGERVEVRVGGERGEVLYSTGSVRVV